MKPVFFVVLSLRKLRLDWIKIKRNESSEISENLYVDVVYIGPAYPQGYDTYGECVTGWAQLIRTRLIRSLT